MVGNPIKQDRYAQRPKPLCHRPFCDPAFCDRQHRCDQCGDFECECPPPVVHDHNRRMLDFLSVCCGAHMVNHWPCEVPTECSKCGVCPKCGGSAESQASYEAELGAMREQEKRFRRRR